MSKTYRIYERVSTEKTINFCNECDFSSYSQDKDGFHCAICTLHQQYLETEKTHIPIPSWCKIDECKYTFSEVR